MLEIVCSKCVCVSDSMCPRLYISIECMFTREQSFFWIEILTNGVKARVLGYYTSV